MGFCKWLKMGIIGVIWLIGVMNLATKSPRPSKYATMTEVRVVPPSSKYAMMVRNRVISQ